MHFINPDKNVNIELSMYIKFFFRVMNKKLYATHFQLTLLGCYALCGYSQYQGSGTLYFHRSFHSHNLSQLHGLQWHLSRKKMQWHLSKKNKDAQDCNH
jgi:hypothetical protein